MKLHVHIPQPDHIFSEQKTGKPLSHTQLFFSYLVTNCFLIIFIRSQFKYYQEEKQGACQNFDPIDGEWRGTEVNIFLLSSFGVGVHLYRLLQCRNFA